MEDKKLQFLIDFCNRTAKNRSVTKEEVFRSITTAVQMQESNARNKYSESLSEMNSEDFVQMLILDGCYILELMLKDWDCRNDNISRRAFHQNEKKSR